MDDAGAGGATEPITLTDPDGAVTRVAPWSSWTREQVRAPGGEPALVTRLDQGQLWFAAGRRRSPWHHEVHVGPAVVSTPRGRFHATAEPDGGATIVCLSGRTRVVAGLREPVLLGPDQSAAISADGRTLLVMDRESLDAEAIEPMLDLAPVEDEPSDAVEDPSRRDEPEPEPAPREPDPVVPVDAGSPRRERRFGWLPDLVAIAALVALLIAAIVVFGGPGSDDGKEQAAPRRTSTTRSGTEPVTTTTVRTTTTQAPETTTTAVPSTTSKPPPTLDSGATALGELTACRRAEGGVKAAVRLSHRRGGAAQFKVAVGLVDGGGQVFAQGEAFSSTIEPGGSATVDVLVSTSGRASGSCELLGITAR